MSLRDKIKQERTLPVSTRIDLVNLARMDLYYQLQGYHIKTVSQLINWCVDLLCEVLIANKAMDTTKITTLGDAVTYLKARGMMQVGTARYTKKIQQKLGTSIRYETLRGQGKNPEQIDPAGHSELHRKDSIIPPPDMEVIRPVEEVVAEASQAAKDSGMIVDDDWEGKRRKADADIIAKENAPIDTTGMTFAKE